MVENLPSVLEHFLAGCSSCFVEFSAALEALSFALDVACSALGIAYSARDARRVKLPFALGVACSALGVAYSARDARRVKLPFALGVAYLTTKSVQKFHSYRQFKL